MSAIAGLLETAARIRWPALVATRKLATVCYSYSFLHPFYLKVRTPTSYLASWGKRENSKLLPLHKQSRVWTNCANPNLTFGSNQMMVTSWTMSLRRGQASLRLTLRSCIGTCYMLQFLAHFRDFADVKKTVFSAIVPWARENLPPHMALCREMWAQAQSR